MKSSNDIMHAALRLGIGLPAFNIAHLPMTEPAFSDYGQSCNSNFTCHWITAKGRTMFTWFNG